MYKQKVKHLLYEHQNNITALKVCSRTVFAPALRQADKNVALPCATAHSSPSELKAVLLAHRRTGNEH